MTDEPKNTQDTKQVLSDLRDLIAPSEVPSPDTSETSETATTEVLESLVEVEGETAAEVEVEAETETIDPEPQPEPLDWRQAEPPAAASDPAAAPQAQTLPPLPPPYGPQPTYWQANNAAPVTPVLGRRNLRVGTLVWGGILLIMSVLVFIRLVFPHSSGVVLFVLLLAFFGLVLLGIGIVGGGKSSRNGPGSAGSA